MNIKSINNKISYIPANNNPLSADIGIIKEEETWLFDVGNGFNNIAMLTDNYNVVISHFHLDHLGNIAKLKINKLYVSKETYRHLPKEVTLKSEVIIVEDELKLKNLRIFNIPSSHSKGSLALEVDGKYTFLGDAIYARFKNNQLYYNSQLLHDEIKALKNLKSEYLLVSHHIGLIRSKAMVIKELEEIYSLRAKNNPEIIINNEM